MKNEFVGKQFSEMVIFCSGRKGWTQIRIVTFKNVSIGFSANTQLQIF